MALIAPSPFDGATQDRGIGFRSPESVGPTNGGESIRQPEDGKQSKRQPFELVGANGETVPRPGELVEGDFDPGKRTGALRDMVRVMLDEGAHESIGFVHWEHASRCLEGTFDHHSGAASDHVARAVVIDGRQTLAGENRIQRCDQVGRRVDQRSVKVEDDDGRIHAV